MMCLRIRHVLLSSRGIMCSCKMPAREEKTPLGVQLAPVLQPTAAGENRREPLVQSVQKVLAVVVDQEMHPKGICFLMGI